MRGDPDNPRDTEDHRCVVGPRHEPMTVDTRLLLALPNYETPEGKKDLMRLALLGNPRPFEGRGGRTLELTAQSIYAEQAKLQVRGKIREICAQYDSVEAVFTAVADTSEKGLSQKSKRSSGRLRQLSPRARCRWPSSTQWSPTSSPTRV